MTLDDIMRLLTPLKNRMYGIVGRAILTAIDNTKKTQMVQIKMFGDEVHDLERFEEYGFETMPDVASGTVELAVLAPAGDRAAGIVVCAHNRETRPKTLAAGEVMVYSKFGQSVHLKADGSIVLNGPVYLNGTGGQPVLLETVIAKFNAHVHSGGGTGVPTVAWVPGTDSAAAVKAKP